MSKSIIIFDLDDTIANTYHRSINFDFDNATDEEWDEYFLKCNKDLPIEQSVAINNYFYNSSDYRVEIWTGRNEIAKEKTIRWLKNNGIYYDKLKMRPIDCRKKNVDLKKSWAEEVGFDKIFLVIDDNKKVCDMFAHQGVLCYNVLNINDTKDSNESKNI